MMGWMMDEYSRITGVYTPGVITGKPVGGGGRGKDRSDRNRRHLYRHEAMRHLKMDPTKTVAAIQGFGNVAQYASRAY